MTVPGGGDVTATGRLIFDASAVRSGVSQAHSDFSSLYDVVRDNWWGIKAIGEAFAAVGGSIAGGLGESIHAAANFQTQMAAVARTTAEQGESAAQSVAATSELGKQLQALAEIKPVDLSTLTGIAEQAGALGIARKDVADFTASIADLVTTSNLTAQGASSGLAKIANIFGIAGPEFKQLSSAIYETGVNTAATESDIVNMTTRLAPFAQQAGLSAAQTVGLSAALLSLGPRAEAGATSLQRLLGQMAGAATGQDATKLKDFALIAGVTAQEFQKLVQIDPGTALEKFLSGLAGGTNNAVAFHTALADIGITEQREITTIGALVSGLRQGADSQVSLGTAIRTATDAYNDGNVVQRAAAQQNKTLNAEIKETKNTITNFAITVGDDFVPVMSSGVHSLQMMAIGFENLPPGIRQASEITASAVGTTTLLIAAFALIAPRISLAVASYSQLRTSLATVIAAQQAKVAVDGEEAASSLRTAFAAGANYSALQAEMAAKARQASLITLTSDLRAAELAVMLKQTELEQLQVDLLMAESEGNSQLIAVTEARIAATEASLAATEQSTVALAGEVAALEVSDVAMGTATVAATALGAAMSFLTGPIGLIILAVGAAAAATYLFGRHVSDSKDQVEQAATANLDYVAAIKRVEQGEKDAVNATLAHDLAMKGVIGTAQNYGLSLKQLVAYITGAAIDINSINFDAALANGDTAAQGLQKTLSGMRDTFSASVQSVNDEANANAALGSSADDASNSLNGLQNSTKSLAQTQEDASNAAANLAGDDLSVQQATVSLQKAQTAYNQALRDAKDRSDQIRKATLDYQSAQLQSVKAAEAVKTAEQNLATARGDAQKKLSDDQRQAANDQNKYLDSIDKIQAAEDALHKLQSEDQTLKVKEATDKLATARLSLVNATVKANDAQYYLNYLQSEGASARDIADAQRALNDANQNVANSTNDVADAQNNLIDVQSIDYAEELAKAERDVAQAVRDSQAALEKLHEDQQQVKKDQQDIAHDTAYRDATIALKEAQISYEQAMLAAKDAQNKLADTKDATNSQLSLRDAQLQVEQSALALAEAQTQYQVDQRTANGETVTAYTRLQLLRSNLLSVAATITSPVRPQVQALARELAGMAAGPGGSGYTTNLNVNTKPAYDQLNNFSKFFSLFIKEISQTKLTPEFNGAVTLEILGTNGLGTDTTNHASGGIFSSPTNFTYDGSDHRLGEAGSEAVVPLNQFWRSLEPLGAIAAQTRASTDLLTQLVQVQAVNAGAASQADHRVTNYNDIKVTANTAVDVDNIGKDIVWEIAHA